MMLYGYLTLYCFKMMIDYDYNYAHTHTHTHTHVYTERTILLKYLKI